MAAGPDGRIAAERAARGVAYRCSQCGQGATLKRGSRVTAHFAHRAASACLWAHGETAEHREAKAAFARAFAARGLDVALEAEVLSGGGDRRADVLVRDPRTGARVAIEIQHSAISPEQIEARTRAYAAAGVKVIWIPTLGQTAPRPLARARLHAVDRYAVPAWQRFAAAYHGTLWFWHAGAVWRGWLDQAWVAGAGRGEDGGEGWRPSRRWQSLTLEGPFDPSGLRIAPSFNRIEAHEEFALGQGFAANFVLAGERARNTAPTAMAWRDRHARGGRRAPHLEIIARPARTGASRAA